MPAGQGTQGLPEKGPYVPAAHISHWLESVAAVTLVEEPPGQKTHALEVVWPGLGLNLPSGHAVHTGWPVLGL